MPAPSYSLTNNQSDSHQRNPAWLVAFVRFKNPGAMFSGGEPFEEYPRILSVINDCTAVSINNPKSSFAKTCSLTMKVGDIWYLNAASPGDWVFVWMADDEEHITEIASLLDSIQGIRQSTNNSSLGLNSWNSGLKFMGRVTGVNSSDTISGNGTRSLGQTVSCQAFTEMATSIYYTFVAQSILTFDNKENTRLAGQSATVAGIAAIQADAASNGMEAALTNLSEAFDKFYGTEKTVNDVTPDRIIPLLFVLIMGIDSDLNLANAIKGVAGSVTDAIGIPKSVAKIMGKPNATKLWQLYTAYMGLQQYAETGKNVWEKFSPKLDANSKANPKAVFFNTPIRCKGFVPPSMPPIWDGHNLWSTLQQYLNPTVNEMYTALRANHLGKIVPTFMVREQPFSTDLFNDLVKKAPAYTTAKRKPNEKVQAIKAKINNGGEAATSKINELVAADREKRAEEVLEALDKAKLDPAKIDRTRSMYENIPRWIITEEVLKSINVATSESARVNFVQVWGRSSAADWAGFQMSPERWKQLQFLLPNYVADELDIKRHGLRADITETAFDFPSTDGGSLAQLFCRMRADWLFNGHLKLTGTITLRGVVEPICEGDNLEVRGIVFHIENVSHQGAIATNGTKTFNTVITVSNGIKVSSFIGKKKIPRYVRQDGVVRDNIEKEHPEYNLPGNTDVESTGRLDRTWDGNKVKKD